MLSPKLTRFIAAGTAAVVVATGACAVGNPSSSNDAERSRTRSASSMWVLA